MGLILAFLFVFGLVGFASYRTYGRVFVIGAVVLALTAALWFRGP